MGLQKVEAGILYREVDMTDVFEFVTDDRSSALELRPDLGKDQPQKRAVAGVGSNVTALGVEGEVHAETVAALR